jgi:hypothetical protein
MNDRKESRVYAKKIWENVVKYKITRIPLCHVKGCEFSSMTFLPKEGEVKFFRRNHQFFIEENSLGALICTCDHHKKMK